MVQNSYSKIEGPVHPDIDQLIKQLLTYKNEIEGERGQLFYQLKLAKRHGNNKQYYATLGAIKKLEDNEYVCLYKNNVFPTGLLNVVLEGLKALNASYELCDLRQNPGSTAIIRWNNPPWEPRYYQKDMIALGLKHGRGVFEAAVGSGKSLVMASIIKETSVNSLVIVPSRGLSGQLYNDFVKWFGFGAVKLLDAEKIRKIRSVAPVNIVTVQSLASLKKSGEFKAFANKIDAVHCDEIHHAGADSYLNLLEDLEHVYYRFGYTGTFLRNDTKTLPMWGFLSNVLYKYPARVAIKEGFLTPLEVKIHNMAGKSHIDYQKEYDNSYSNNPELLETIHQICVSNSKDQILILVSKKDKCGLIIHEYLNTLGVSNCYVTGDNSKEEINRTIEAFNDKQFKILVGSSVFGEGVNLSSTDHLILCQGGKSPIAIVQALGRAVRLHPGKSIAKVYDFNFQNTNYMSKHQTERLEVIIDNFDPVKVEYT